MSHLKPDQPQSLSGDISDGSAKKAWTDPCLEYLGNTDIVEATSGGGSEGAGRPFS